MVRIPVDDFDWKIVGVIDDLFNSFIWNKIRPIMQIVDLRVRMACYNQNGHH